MTIASKLTVTRQFSHIVRPFTLQTYVLFLACCLSLASGALRADVLGDAIVNDRLTDTRTLSARILGGADAEAGEYPSIVALVSPGFIPLDQRLFCGGTVVAETWVLTAAHCLYDSFGQPLQPGFIRVIAGITDLAEEQPEREIQVERVIIHPDYDRLLELPPNDIALLELQSAAPAPISTLFTGETDNDIGSMAAIAGWGAIEFTDAFNAVYPTMLQEAFVPLVSDQTCNAPQSYDGSIVDSHLCAGFVDGQVDACAGDSGGPLYITRNGVQVQAGISSFGIGCGLPLFYGIYTEVSFFIPWLSQYIAVPFQSPDLVAQRISPDLAASNSQRESVFAGALGWQGMLMLLVMTGAFRRKFTSQTSALI